MSTYKVTVVGASFSEVFAVEADAATLSLDGHLQLWRDRESVARFAPGWSAMIKLKDEA